MTGANDVPAATVIPWLCLSTIWILGAVGTYRDRIIPGLQATRAARPRTNRTRVHAWVMAFAWPLDLILGALRVWPLRLVVAWLGREWKP